MVQLLQVTMGNVCTLNPNFCIFTQLSFIQVIQQGKVVFASKIWALTPTVFLWCECNKKMKNFFFEIKIEIIILTDGNEIRCWLM